MPHFNQRRSAQTPLRQKSRLGEPGETATSARRPATRARQGKARLKILRGEELSVFVNCLWPALNVVNGDQETGANCVDDCRI
jgi:hypothetical protein